VPRRSKPAEDRDRRYPRLNVEIYPDEQMVVRKAQGLAVMRGEPFREFLMRALATEIARVERESGGGR
jgi:hypothetical protein